MSDFSLLFRFFLISLTMLAGLNGCQSGGIRGLVPASGIVLYDGKPAGGVIIVFTPAPGSSAAYVGTAVTADNGTFSIQTLNQTGLQPGNYGVTFSKTTTLPKTSGGNQDPDAMDYAPPEIITKQELPDGYLSTATSGITISISNGGDKNIRFELQADKENSVPKPLPAI